MARMTTIIRDTRIDVTPADAWAALSDFGGVHQHLAVGFVADSTLDAPDVRTIRFFNGAVAKERLVGLDEDARRLAYTVIESGLGPSHHNSSAQIIEDAKEPASSGLLTFCPMNSRPRSQASWTLGSPPSESPSSTGTSRTPETLR